ncbi:MAG: radical SAM protein [Candidatus Marinimicrobia bacterium]|nr:radical SAM protein [Candidatus Neomarinimicrobiota bacterium]
MACEVTIKTKNIKSTYFQTPTIVYTLRLSYFSKMNAQNILLINPWIADFAAYDLWAKPLGLLYIGKFLRRHGYKIQLIDLADRQRWGNSKSLTPISGRGKYHKTIIPKPASIAHVPRHYGLYGATREQFISELKSIEVPNLILVTSHMSYWYPGVSETVKILRDVFPESKIVLGGIYATLFPDHARQIIQPDYLMTGYGEKQSLQLADSLFGITRDDSAVPNTLDSGILPWDLYPRLHVATLLTSRGCPMHCDYCASPYLNPNFIQRTPEDVVAEIVHLYARMNVQEFAFYDDALFTNKKHHISPILKSIINHKIQAMFHTPNGLFARDIDGGLAQLMKESGFKTIRLSLESIIPVIQTASTNKVSTHYFECALDNLEKAGFQRKDIETYLIMGLPGQKYSDVEITIRYVFEQGALSRLAAYSPIPHTMYWDMAKKSGHVWDEMDPLLTNNTLYPCATADFPVEKFMELRQLSNQLNANVKSKT